MARRGWPLLPDGRPRHSWLRACWALENGAELLPAAHAVCTGAVFSDAARRLTRFGGRDGVPRSLASVYSCWVALFLQGSLRQRRSVRLDLDPHEVDAAFSLAVCRDGAAVLVLVAGIPYLLEFDAHTGAFLSAYSRFGAASIRFGNPQSMCVAPDGFVFVLGAHPRVVHAATRTLTFVAVYGAGGQLTQPVTGLCAGTDFVAVSECGVKQITVFSRSSTDVLRRIRTLGDPFALCVLPASNDIAVIARDADKGRFHFETATGAGVQCSSKFILPLALAASVYDEYVVVDAGAGEAHPRIEVLSDAAASTLTTSTRFFAASVHDGAVVTVEWRSGTNWLCVWD
jgi:hypothetical protein